MKPTAEQLKDFVNKYSWRNQMDNSKGLDSWSNYGGEDMGHRVVVVGRNRDSELLDESNFSAALERLGGESETVEVERFGHWGCGWFELILVSPDDEAKLIEAYNIKSALNYYPVLDEGDYFERQSESFAEYAEDHKHDLAEALATHFGLDVSPALVKLAYHLNVEDQHSNGEDSCINVYSMREPDAHDLRKLSYALNGLEHAALSKGEEELREYLIACLGEG